MKWRASPSPLAALALARAAAASGASSPTIVPTGAPAIPDRSYLLTLPAAKALDASQIKVTENGFPVSGLESAREGASARSRSAVVLEIDASLTMKGKPIQDAFAAARAFATQRIPTRKSRSWPSTAAVERDPAVHLYDSASLRGARDGRRSSPSDEDLRRARGRALQQIAAAPRTARSSSSPTARCRQVAKPSAVLHSLRPRTSACSRSGSYSQGIQPGDAQADRLGEQRRVCRGDQPRPAEADLRSIGQRSRSEYLVAYRSPPNPKTQLPVAVDGRRAFPAPREAAYLSPPLKIVPAHRRTTRRSFRTIIQSS